MNARKSFALLATASVGAAALLAAPAAQAGGAATKPAPVAGSAAVVTDGELAGIDQVAGPRLKPYQSRYRTMPLAGKPHGYHYRNVTSFWTVIAAWSPDTGDVDLDLYDDRDRTELAGRSGLGTGITDFVAVDGNHRALGSYFPSVSTFGGSGAYYVEYASGIHVLNDAPEQLPMQGDDIVSVWDTYLAAGETYTITLEPNSPQQDGDLFLMGSSMDDPSTWVRSRSSALAYSSTYGKGGTETITFTPSVSDYYGVVVINEALAGTFTLTRTS